MKKEESIFVTEGYLRRELIAIMFLLEGIGDKRNKRHVFKVELHSSHTQSLTTCLTLGERLTADQLADDDEDGSAGRALTTT